MAYTVEDEKHFMLECPAYQEIRSEFGELFDYCEGDLRKLMCHPKQHMLAKLVHKMRVFRDEDTEWVFDLQLDRFESSEDESCGDVSSDEYENELVELDDISQFGFLELPLSLVLAPGFSFFKCNIQTVMKHTAENILVVVQGRRATFTSFQVAACFSIECMEFRWSKDGIDTCRRRSICDV